METAGSGDNTQKKEPATEVGEESSVGPMSMGSAFGVGGVGKGTSTNLYLGDIVAYSGMV